ncbi:MAG: hypothetical protein L6437_12285, partial [Kiritimatiellae bacterium]|nr:hypothetical protein [Kiritimatiellia bacterium]
AALAAEPAHAEAHPRNNCVHCLLLFFVDTQSESLSDRAGFKTLETIDSAGRVSYNFPKK